MAGDEPQSELGGEGIAATPLRSLEGELLLLIGRQAQQVLYKVLTAATLLALLIADFSGWTWPAVWWAAILSATFFYRYALGRLGADGERPENRRLSLAAGVVVMHGAMQAVPLAFFPFVPITVGAVITIYLLGIASATMHGTAGVRRIYLPYLVVTVGTTAVVWALAPIPDAGPQGRAVFVGLLVLFLLTMYGHSRGAYQLLVDSYAIRRQREDLMRQLREALAEAESANRSKTRFLAAASHDLRQPIHALSLFSGALNLRPLDARAAAIATQIDKSVQSVASLLDGLLDISRLDAGVVERTMIPVDLESIFGQLQEEFASLAAEKGLVLRVACEARGSVRTDPLLFQRVLRNLMSNAIKYTERGEVELSARWLEGGCLVRVRDTGRGIPEDEQERVFEEFYQLHNPERDRSQGLGLGLAIVRRLARLLDLRLSLESRTGQGTQVEMMLAPAQLDGASVAAPDSAAAAPQESLKVLVVDDEESIRVGMTTLLEGFGYSVRAEASTEEAVAAACRFRPAIVLADFRLRGQDNGMRAITALRAIWPGLPALLISGDTAPDRLREAHAAGIDLLHKPISASVLRDSILRAVRA